MKFINKKLTKTITVVSCNRINLYKTRFELIDYNGIHERGQIYFWGDVPRKNMYMNNDKFANKKSIHHFSFVSCPIPNYFKYQMIASPCTPLTGTLIASSDYSQLKF